MKKSFAVKRLTKSDLTIFEPIFRRDGKSKQKAINLNARVFSKSLFPFLGNHGDQKSIRIQVRLNFWGPDIENQTKVSIDRVIVKSDKNWRIDGGLIRDEPVLFSQLLPGDLALFEFLGEDIPSSIDVYLISQSQQNSSDLFKNFDNWLHKDAMREAAEYEVSNLVCKVSLPVSSPFNKLANSIDSLKPMEIFDKEYDEVLRSIFCSGKATYAYAKERFIPRIDAYFAQRRVMDEKFYAKLERDIVSGCIMPPITIAIVVSDIEKYRHQGQDAISSLLEERAQTVYILDGIQRLNTLRKVYKEEISEYKIYVNLIVSDSEDRLLYRMITLNNGQKPMSAKHQIEVLAHSIFDFGESGLPIQSEKERSKKKIKGSFDKSDIIKGYIAYMSGEVNIDNQKIIESKLDELIAEKIISSIITESGTQFIKVIEKIEEFVNDEYLGKWFRQSNNLIGYCAGMGKGYAEIAGQTPAEFAEHIFRLEKAFEDYDVSKIKLGLFRRMLVFYFVSNYQTFKDLPESELRSKLSNASILMF